LLLISLLLHCLWYSLGTTFGERKTCSANSERVRTSKDDTRARRKAYGVGVVSQPTAACVSVLSLAMSSTTRSHGYSQQHKPFLVCWFLAGITAKSISIRRLHTHTEQCLNLSAHCISRLSNESGSFWLSASSTNWLR